jgi:hypothetical protein
MNTRRSRRRPFFAIAPVLLAGWLLQPSASGAQMPASASADSMKRVDFLVGTWKGESWIEYRPGERQTASMIETVESRLDGLVLTLEGVGRAEAPGTGGEAIVHHAFAVLSYDAGAGRYQMRAVRKGSGSVDANVRAGDGMLEWGFEHPQAGKIRYTIRLNEKGQWFEIGERSTDGTTWTKFFEMTLDRQK